MGDPNKAPESPLKACLIAPTFKIGKVAAITTASRSTDATNTNSKSSTHYSSIDNAVRKAYKKVRHERDLKRKKLVSSVLRESRDGVINEIVADKKKEMTNNNNCIHASHDGKISESSDAREKKRRNNNGVAAANGEANTSPRRKKKSRNNPTGGHDVSDESNQSASTLQTLVFPRLPSNGCPAHRVFFVPPLLLCEPCKVDETIQPAVLPPNNLPKPSNCQNNEYALTIKTSRGGGRNNKQTTTTATTTTSTTHRPLIIEGSHPPRPKSSSLIFLKSALAVDDEPSLSHVPYFGDGDNEDIYSELFDTKERERLYEFGPKYQEEETFATMDEVLRLMAAREPRLFGNAELYDAAITTNKQRLTGDGGVAKKERAKGTMQSNVQKLERIHLILSELTDVDLERVHERHSFCFRQGGESDKPKASSEEHPKKGKEADLGIKKNSDTPVVVPYESIMDSYRDLFCRRCFTYDCNLHGNLPKANLDLLGELAVQKERDGHWKELDKDIELANTSPNGKLEEDIVELTPAQQSICQRAYSIFQGDIEKVAHAIGAMPATVDAFVKSKKIDLIPNKFVTAQLSSSKKNQRSYTSMKNYNQKWLRHIQSKVIHPAFLPCDHDGPCNDDNCSCVTNGFFCTKHCGWGCKSANFFRGCECKAGQCRLNSCPCYAANRECDPDLCRTCGACSDGPDAPATGDGQRCRNDNISMRRHAHTLIGESRIKEAGWGIFTKHSLKKGDFVIEYVGEQISQEEAERRGVIYDKMNMSYLFNLSSDLVVDATRKGNKARYANHSSTPNIEPKLIHVNGDMRIGFFAKQDIDAQSELFFDYRYDDQMDNELIFKPDHSVNFEWMKKNK
mmetsp:Transcript_8388/g.18797  ORF Transcript_8388/g.18797 Transcript_8388/m.18797 type:complete len:851 (+) Transcript_8388:112-2664(+)|eukprot:CAMPEP_0172315192 /NCGR_PEP_ID=MMETSP1058-20130122/24372_1 /TAXON_ID=83371 /ORGANISM="Detonula confervacea, Strain CCMP 353" /LENGTH=850 /DNA_ID=CAMNT_0013029221 /DNA_START=27 /DNA_END=2579 /DNA_ORIENTATION=+